MASQLEGKIDKIIEWLIDGKSYRKIANALKVPLTTLHDYTSKSEHSARVREALIISATTFDEKAEEVLLKLNKNSSLASISRARELAQYYKWKAAKRFPKGYGNKLDVTTDSQPLNKLPDLSQFTFEQLKEIADGKPITTDHSQSS